MNNTLTLNNPLSESDWDKICDAELEKTKHIWFETPSGKRVDFLRADILDVIRAEIEQEIIYKPIDMWDYRMGLTKAVEIIDKYKAESEG